MSKLLEPILGVLADGEFHSGQALAQSLGVSRQAVHHALASLPESIAIERVRGKGYRSLQQIDRLDEQAIVRKLAQIGGAPISVHVHSSLPSTNTHALALARTEYWQTAQPRFTLITCEEQTAGRGRLGRAWKSQANDSLTFSLLWRSTKGIAHLAGLSLAAAVALVEALDSQGLPGVQLKWPNDLMAFASVVPSERALFSSDRPRAKLGGILIETEGDVLGPLAVVIGVGINLRDSRSSLATQVDQSISVLSDVSETATLPSRNELLALLAHHLCEALVQFETDGFKRFKSRWESHAAFLGQRVTLRDATGQSKEGVVQGIDEQGALQLKLDSREVLRVLSGELSSGPLGEAMSQLRVSGD
jgi:BirA family transcriptional regulator, biotin operon repressor / biotin---[acetyl-CoA-carboxylase] ligase